MAQKPGLQALPEMGQRQADHIAKWLQREKIFPGYIDKESHEHTY